MIIIIFFVAKMPVTSAQQHLIAFRRRTNRPELSNSTVVDYYSYCREIAEVVASNVDTVLGGPGKTVQVDETFLTKRKYHRGRLTEQMTIVVLGLYCKEDKTGLFFKVNSKSKADLWPYIRKYIDPNTSYLCTDSAKQYDGVEKIFSTTTVHKATNHSTGEYVDKSDKSNTINDLENQNRQFKQSIASRRTTALLHQYMALFYYRKNCLERKFKLDLGSQIMQFLLDIRKVYPGIVDGMEQEGLCLKAIDPPTVESENLEDFIPKRPRISTIDEEIDEDGDSDPDFVDKSDEPRF